MKKIADIKNATILLVDDDQFLRNMYAAKFAERVGKVEVSGSAEEALERLRGGLSPVLIIFDLIMPGTDGYAFLETLQREKLAPDAAKVALSNQSSTEEIERVMALGADGHLMKANTIPSEIVEKVLAMVS